MSSKRGTPQTNRGKKVKTGERMEEYNRPTPDSNVFDASRLVKREHPSPGLTPTSIVCPPTPRLSSARAKKSKVNYPSPLYISPGSSKIPKLETILAIGSGSFANVWLVRDKDSGLFSALKRNIDPYFVGSESHDKIHESINVWKNLISCPNICKLFSAWEDEGVFVNIQMEYCEGGHLLQYAEKCMEDSNGGYSRIWDEIQIWKCLADTLCGLSQIHQLEFCHNDIKPENLLVTKHHKTGKLKIVLADFGHLRKGNTKIDGEEGDCKYISQEMLRDGLATCASDMFSVGISFYEVVSDICLPDHGEWYSKLREGDVPRIPTQFSADLNDVIQKMMSADPKSRPSSMELLDHKCVQDSKDVELEKVDIIEDPEAIAKVMDSRRDGVSTPTHSAFSSHRGFERYSTVKTNRSSGSVEVAVPKKNINRDLLNDFMDCQ